VPGALVTAMAGTLAHRGPHGSHQLVDGPLGLAHRLLRSTPEAAHEAQPFVLGSLAITADIRLDYRDDLLRLLELRRGAERPPGDAELVLRAYQRWGEDCVRGLAGDFAFALWDGDRRVLFCARDHFGARPFIYASTPSLFAFASEAKAILAIPEIPRALNEARIGDFLAGGIHEGFDPTVTFFSALTRLPPAHSLSVSQEGVTIRRYWSVLGGRDSAVLSPADAVDGFRTHLVGAVRERLRGGPAVGSMLSGGLDSSSIVAIASEIRRQRGEPPLRTFSCVEEDAVASRESDYIRVAAGVPGVQSTFIEPRDVDALAGAFDDLCDTIDEPFDLMDTGLVVYRAASRAGLTAVMDGCDGDLVASRNGTARFAFETGRWLGAWREASATARWSGDSLPATLWQEAIRPGLRNLVARVPWLDRLRDARRRGLRPHARKLDSGLIRQSFADRIDIDGRWRQALERLSPARWPPLTPDEEYAHWLESGLVPAALERYDRVAASQSIEPRHPLFDKKLVSFYAAVPWDSAANEGLPKAILRRAAAGHLSPVLRDRRFAPPVDGTGRRLIRLKNSLICTKLAEGNGVDEFVDIERLRASTLDGSVSDERRREIARVALLAAWLGRVRH